MTQATKALSFTLGMRFAVAKFTAAMLQIHGCSISLSLSASLAGLLLYTHVNSFLFDVYYIDMNAYMQFYLEA
jgi:hypothetical protein